MTTPNFKKSGFTIAELLVVIVVIGVLAAVTIVSYTGVNQRAVAAALSSDLDGISRQLKLDQVINSIYPATLNDANSGKGVPACSGLTSCQYTVNNSMSPQTFCVTATKSNQSYYINQDSKPTAGGCSGDIVAGVPSITNLVTNPSFEVGSMAGYGFNSSPGTQTVISDNSMSGSYILHMLSTSTIAVSTVGPYIQVYNISPSESSYTFSVWIRTNKPMSYKISAERRDSGHVGIGVVSGNSVTTVANTWTRLTLQMPTLSNIDHVTFCVYSNAVSWAPGDWVDFDGLMVTKGTDVPNYADGNSRNWSWNGTANNSTSTGPAI